MPRDVLTVPVRNLPTQAIGISRNTPDTVIRKGTIPGVATGFTQRWHVNTRTTKWLF